MARVTVGRVTPYNSVSAACGSCSEDQLVVRPGSGGPLAFSAATLAQLGLAPGHPRAGQLIDLNAEMCTVKAAGGAMGQGRTGPVMRHNITNPSRPPSCHGPAAATAC